MISFIFKTNVILTIDFNVGKPKSPKTRMRGHTARIKDNKDACLFYLQKDNKRKEVESGMEKQYSLSANVIKHQHALNRERVANYRSKKKLSDKG